MGGLLPRCSFIPTQRRLTNEKPFYTEAPRRAAQDSAVAHGNNISAPKDKYRNTIFSWNNGEK